MHQTQIVSIVLELLSDKNPNIRVLINAILDYVQIHDENWKQEIKAKRFQVHNSMYLQVIEEYDQQNPMMQLDPMSDMYYYDQQQNYGAYGNELDDEIDGYDSDENLHGLYVESLDDRRWDDADY